MTIEEHTIDVWSADAAAIALVPASRFKVPGVYQGMTRPYVVMFPITESQFETHGGGALGVRQWLLQFSIFGNSYSSMKAIAEQMRETLHGSHGDAQYSYLRQFFLGKDAETNVEHLVVEFRVFESLA